MAKRSAGKYQPPAESHAIGFWSLLEGVRRIPASQSKRLLLPGMEEAEASEPTLYYAGDLGLVSRPSVAIVGSRSVSAEGAARARKLARQLSEKGVVVVSGLAEGVDTAAHEATIEAGGRTIAVIGTPLGSAYPAKNARLQERIYREHLLVTPFREGSRVFRSNFPQRNKFMAAVSDATVIIEASDTSGSLHQAAECAPRRLDRWLFIARSVLENPKVTWPQRFLGGPKVRILDRVEDLLDVVLKRPDSPVPTT